MWTRDKVLHLFMMHVSFSFHDAFCNIYLPGSGGFLLSFIHWKCVSPNLEHHLPHTHTHTAQDLVQSMHWVPVGFYTVLIAALQSGPERRTLVRQINVRYKRLYWYQGQKQRSQVWLSQRPTGLAAEGGGTGIDPERWEEGTALEQDKSKLRRKDD